MILTILLSSILTLLGILHFYWAAGGKFGFALSLPTNEHGERVLNPRRIDSVIVGFGLTLFGAFYLIKSGLIQIGLPEWIGLYGGWTVPIIFLLRATGEFRYVGFFKCVKNTEFARLDTKIFSPLCLAIGIIGLIIQLNY